MTTLAELVVDSQPADREDFICRNSIAAWAERKRGFVNAPFHKEWYRVAARSQRLALLAPREHAKTEVLTINRTVHRCIYTPGIWTYVFCATGDLAKGLLERINNAMEEVAPEMVQNARKDTTMEVVYANGSKVQVAGAGKAVRSVHPDVIIGDDVLTDDAARTDEQRKKMRTWWFGTVGGMAHPGTTRRIRGYGRITFPSTKVFLVGTPFHSQDLLMGMRTNPLYEFRRYAAEYDPAQLVPGTWAVEIRRG
jgi:hypothetical protein